MRRWVVCVLIACVGLPAAQAAPAKPIKLEGMEYNKARQIILGYGWKPLRGACTGGGADTKICAPFPEIDDCSGSGQGYCGMNFVKLNQCLIIVTTGGAPHLHTGDTHIDGVMFRHGACPKDPQ